MFAQLLNSISIQLSNLTLAEQVIVSATWTDDFYFFHRSRPDFLL